ncbi:MAG: DUF3429 domain-containing protein [Natronospirillum sp.]|uniref:DUF3429 domain-containing protein n=1 Tax=Natronospirillum sp. TaxID=2812955 RepID=UPI0025EBC69A|nr:DUF3429 domain-containing protein [Natronospirillum sp.]MCH8551824.1 DUF3429 domain-containing protein [Natronospirillum sp.]
MIASSLRRNPPLVLSGGLAGLLPFVGSAIALQVGWSDAGPFLTYSVIILSFLAGVNWWYGLQQKQMPSVVVGLMLPALAWLALFLPTHLTVLALGTGFLLLWAWEMLIMHQVYTRGYALLRTVLTLGVLATHVWAWLVLV